MPACTSCVTMLPEPMTALAPMVTPGKMQALSPIHTLSSIVTGPLDVTGRCAGGIVYVLCDSPCMLSMISTRLPIYAFLPMVIRLTAEMWHAWLIMELSSMLI